MEFKKILFGAFYTVFRYRGHLARALLLPFVVLVAVEATAFWELPILVEWALLPLVWAIYAIFAITTHRVVLLGAESVPKWGVTSWSKRETYFILHLMGIGLVLFPLALLSVIPVIGSIAAIAIYLWLLSRLSLVFPGIAIDKGVTFKLSWKLTENYQIPVFLVILVPPILFSIPALLLQLAPYGWFLSNVFSSLIVVFEIAALSLAYQAIISTEYGGE